MTGWIRAPRPQSEPLPEPPVDKLRERAEAVVEAWSHDVLTGRAPGITLADMIETELREVRDAAMFRAKYLGKPEKPRRQIRTTRTKP